MLPCCRSSLSQVAPQEISSSTSSADSLIMAVEQDTNTITTPLEMSVGSAGAFSVPTNDSSFLPTSGLTTLQSDYKVLESVGVGCYGLANIILTYHKPTKFFGVIRQIDLDMLTAQKLEEIQLEMSTSKSLSHPNIISYLCSFVCDSKLWAVQQLMHYGSCADIMHSVKQFNNGFQENVISIILRDIVRAVHYLHSLGFVHRSIRAKHFLINDQGVVKLSGLRSVVSLIQGGSRKKSLHGHFSGTSDNICWLAPEVLAQDTAGYSYRSDIYSIGIAALELATGEAPFAGLPLTEIMMLKLRGHPPMLLRRQDNNDPMQQFTKTFFKVVNLCVDPNPSHRPETSRLLQLSFLKFKKKTSGLPSLQQLLLPVVPLDTSQEVLRCS